MPSPPTITAGSPGGFARRLAFRAHVASLAAAAVAAGCVWLIAPRLSPTSPASPFLVVALITAVSALALCRHYWGRAQAATVGARSERRVARTLAHLSPHALLHSVDLESGGDADHLVVGPHLVVVETKTGTGAVRYEGGKMYVGRKLLRGDPVAQCRRQARAAGRHFGVFCDAVVCIVDMTNAPFTVNNTLVCSQKDLPAVFYKLPHRLASHAPSAVRARILDLVPRCSTIHTKQVARRAQRPAAKATPSRSRSTSQPIASTKQPTRSRTLRPTPPQHTTASNAPSRQELRNNPSSTDSGRAPNRKLTPKKSTHS